MSITSIIKSKYSGNKARLYEASLARIWQHVKDPTSGSFALLTSWRQSNSRKDNIKEFGALKKSIRNLGLGFVVVRGHWQECQDPTVSYADCPEEDLVDAVEPSLFIPGISLKDAKKLGSAHKQDAIVYGGPEANGRVVLVFNDGSTQDIGEFKPQTLGQAFSELRTSKEANPRYFKFEGIEYSPQGFIQNLIDEEIRKLL